LAASKVETKQNELETEYNKFVKKLNSDRDDLKKDLLAQMPLFKESLKAKFSKL
jgi:F-type H+-transporting ATPase subunit b